MKILTLTTLYPNAAQPTHCVFVENRLRHLLQLGSIEARVVAPVPWFPFRSPRFGRYAAFAAAPRAEDRFGIPVQHPRYPLLPKVSMNMAPLLLYMALKPVIRGIIDSGYDFDLIDSHFFYPDGVAAVMLGRHFGKPVVITARGTDINLMPKFALPRRWILWAAEHAAGMITVCQALKDEMAELGIEADRIQVLRNGVELDLFRPLDRAAARSSFDLENSGPTLLSVGHLIPRKGHDLIIRALPSLPDATLLIAGEGPLRTQLEALADDLGVAGRVRFLGAVDHRTMPDLYNAADVLILASDREGWPNVLLEAMACGTPVVASGVWGTPEVVRTRAAGLLFDQRSAPAIADTVSRILSDPPERSETRRYAEGFSWDSTSRSQQALFSSIIGGPGNRGQVEISKQLCDTAGL